MNFRYYYYGNDNSSRIKRNFGILEKEEKTKKEKERTGGEYRI
jgi:hypothetical protein